MLDAVQKTTCDDIDTSKSQKVKQMIPSDIAQVASVSDTNTKEEDDNKEGKSLRDINPDVMKSIDEGIDSIGNDYISTSEITIDGINSTDSLTVPDCNSQPESDQDSKEEEQNVKNEETNLENFKDHGVISLHYPEEDAQSIDLDVNETYQVMRKQ